MDTPTPKPKSGRPPKLTPDTQAALVAAVAAGVPECFAARAAGVSPSAVRQWKAKGKRAKGGPFLAFLAALKKAQAEAVAKRVRQVEEAAERGTWQAAAWWLERCHPEQFATNRREIRELFNKLRDVESHIARK